MPAPSQWYPNNDAMCCICFYGFSASELYHQANGEIYDVCHECAIDEAYGINRVWDESPERRNEIGAR